jgi:short-subunit dehydrogenase
VALLARGEAGLDAAHDEVEKLGGRALSLTVDVGDSRQIYAAARTVEEMWGPIDIWINNAMLSVFSPAIKMDPAEVRRVTDVTYMGTVHGTMAALKFMAPRNRGTIVQVGSALAYRSIPLQSAYCGAKHGVRGFTDSLRSELIHDGIGVHLTMVQLPALNTPQFEWVKSRLPRRAQPVPPIFQPEVAARAIYWAAHHRRRELFVGWPVWKAVWGTKFFPGLLDRYLAKLGYDAQQTNEPANPNRPNNLWAPLPMDFGAHGRFDAQAKSHSLCLWADMNRHWIVAGGIGAIGLAATMLRWISKRSSSAPVRTDLRQPSNSSEQVAG